MPARAARRASPPATISTGSKKTRCGGTSACSTAAPTASPFLQHVTTACHHCLDPACLTGCPVKAYDKDPETGIVRHFDDQCIGCQYCVFMCPYDVPQYSRTKGIVRKCDMCHDRLAVGEAPACVQSCPNQAIRIRTVSVESVVEQCETGQFLADGARSGSHAPDDDLQVAPPAAAQPVAGRLLFRHAAAQPSGAGGDAGAHAALRRRVRRRASVGLGPVGRPGDAIGDSARATRRSD